MLSEPGCIPGNEPQICTPVLRSPSIWDLRHFVTRVPNERPGPSRVDRAALPGMIGVRHAAELPIAVKSD